MNTKQEFFILYKVLHNKRLLISASLSLPPIAYTNSAMSFLCIPTSPHPHAYFFTGNFLPNHSPIKPAISSGFSYNTQWPASTTFSSKSSTNPCSFAGPI
jgi:hypothetical protein